MVGLSSVTAPPRGGDTRETRVGVGEVFIREFTPPRRTLRFAHARRRAPSKGG